MLRVSLAVDAGGTRLAEGIAPAAPHRAEAEPKVIAMPSPRYEVLQPGALFHGRYRVVQCIKAGGMGAVYEVVDEKTDSRRALKVMLPSLIEDVDLRARFELEARVTGKIESDHLARVSDAGVDDATQMPFLVMDLLQGEELGSLLARRKVLPPGEVVLFLFEAALALDKTHAAGIVHRDLKPENLFVTQRDDGSPCVKVFDFGIAKVVNHGNARATRAIGTPLYMSPEQIRGDGCLGPAVDLYAVGHIAYTLLTGEAYWTEEVEGGTSPFMILSTVLLGATEPPSARAKRRRGVVLPPGFDAWFARATAPRPEDRFDRATNAVAALAIALGVSLPRVSLSVQSLASAPVPATPNAGTAPMTELAPPIVASSPYVAPTELMGAAISSPPAGYAEAQVVDRRGHRGERRRGRRGADGARAAPDARAERGHARRDDARERAACAERRRPGSPRPNDARARRGPRRRPGRRPGRRARSICRRETHAGAIRPGLEGARASDLRARAQARRHLLNRYRPFM
jgi:serine/threonine-protein kinase